MGRYRRRGVGIGVTRVELAGVEVVVGWIKLYPNPNYVR